MKKCISCKNNKSEIDYSVDRQKNSGLSSRCKICEGRRVKEYEKKNPSRTRKSNLRNSFNLSLEQYEDMAIKQDNKCAHMF